MNSLAGCCDDDVSALLNKFLDECSDYFFQLFDENTDNMETEASIVAGKSIEELNCDMDCQTSDDVETTTQRTDLLRQKNCSAKRWKYEVRFERDEVAAVKNNICRARTWTPPISSFVDNTIYPTRFRNGNKANLAINDSPSDTIASFPAKIYEINKRVNKSIGAPLVDWRASTRVKSTGVVKSVYFALFSFRSPVSNRRVFSTFRSRTDYASLLREYDGFIGKSSKCPQVGGRNRLKIRSYYFLTRNSWNNFTRAIAEIRSRYRTTRVLLQARLSLIDGQRTKHNTNVPLSRAWLSRLSVEMSIVWLNRMVDENADKPLFNFVRNFCYPNAFVFCHFDDERDQRYVPSNAQMLQLFGSVFAAHGVKCSIVSIDNRNFQNQ